MRPAFFTFSLITLVTSYVVDYEIEKAEPGPVPDEFKDTVDNIVKDYNSQGDDVEVLYYSDENNSGNEQISNQGPRSKRSLDQDTGIGYGDYQEDQIQNIDEVRINDAESLDIGEDFDIFVKEYSGKFFANEDDENSIGSNHDPREYSNTHIDQEVKNNYSDKPETKPNEWYGLEKSSNQRNKVPDFPKKNWNQGKSSKQGSKYDSDDKKNFNQDKQVKKFKNNYNEGNCQSANLPTIKEFQSSINDDPSSPYPKGQCTEWADGRTYQLTGYHAAFDGNAHLWNDLAINDPQWRISDKPSVGSIIVLEQGTQGASKETGHVAIVESYSGDSICTSNWNSSDLGRTTYKNFKVGPGVSFISHVGSKGQSDSHKGNYGSDEYDDGESSYLNMI